MSDKVIRVENLGKRYQLGMTHTNLLSERLGNGVRSLRQRLLGREAVARPSRSASPQPDEFWALRDVSFEVRQGDVVGIIGRNGAGKSTLLKILSRITSPTTGQIEIFGRVASLLEVGTGFHPELTGRENIYLNGAILGMTKAEVRRKFDEIVDFAEVEKFIDTPVKRYSSGMYVRLAFAVAAHLEPEILIVDEVLAVGDAAFQKKCLGKMGDVAREGRTVLFVSHNMAAVRALCGKAVVLKNGQLDFDGNVLAGIDHYVNSNLPSQSRLRWKNPADRPGDDFIKIHEIAVRPLVGNVIDIDSGFEFECRFLNKYVGINLDFTAYLATLENSIVFESGMILHSDCDSKEGTYSVKGIVPGHLLNSGKYKINIVFGRDQRHVLCRIDDIIAFDIENTATGRGNNMSRAPGIIRPRLDWRFSFENFANASQSS